MSGSCFIPHIINEVPCNILSSTRPFVDDLKMYRPLHNPTYDFHILQKDLDAFAKCSKLWQLNVSYEKKNAMCCITTIEMNVFSGHSVKFFLQEMVFATLLLFVIGPEIHQSLKCSAIAERSSKIAKCVLNALKHKYIEHCRNASVAYCQLIFESHTISLFSDIGLLENIQKPSLVLLSAKFFVVYMSLIILPGRKCSAWNQWNIASLNFAWFVVIKLCSGFPTTSFA